jgi:DNA-binding NarL/FixJ family response regulator
MAVMDRPTVGETSVETPQSADDLAEVLKAIPDVVVVTLPAEGVDPLRICREVADRAPVSRVVVQAATDQAAHAYQAIRVGAWAWVDANATPAEKADVFEGAARDESRLSARLAAWILRELDDGEEQPGARPSADKLTAAERLVLRLMAEGADLDAIGNHLGISARVVGRHAASAVSRLHRRYRRPAEP